MAIIAIFTDPCKTISSLTPESANLLLFRELLTILRFSAIQLCKQKLTRPLRGLVNQKFCYMAEVNESWVREYTQILTQKGQFYFLLIREQTIKIRLSVILECKKAKSQSCFGTGHFVKTSARLGYENTNQSF